jgi:hypothetical protein
MNYDCAHRQGSPRREHHALGFVSNSVCSNFVSNKRHHDTVCLKRVFDVPRLMCPPVQNPNRACASQRLCLPATVWALLTSAHQIVLPHRSYRLHGSTTNDKLYLSSASVLFLLADTN